MDQISHIASASLHATVSRHPFALDPQLTAPAAARLRQVRPLIHEDFVAALANIRASVSQEDLQMYIDWNRRFGTGGAR